MRLPALLEAVGLTVTAVEAPVDVHRVVHDSRVVQDGDLFCCVTGEVHDGHDHAAAAVAAGAVAVVAERPLDLPVPVIVVPDVRTTMGPLSAAVAGQPSRDLQVIGVTGTNGKTSVAHLLADLLTAAGRRVAVSGTLTGERTTPEAPVLQERLAGWRDDGYDTVVMEVSSHALAQHRVDGTRFAAVAFTNLSRDHLDFHGDMAAYAAAKRRLFTRGFSDRAVVVVDDEEGRAVVTAAEAADVVVTVIDSATAGITDDGDGLRLEWRGHTVTLPLRGHFMAVNALVAAELAAGQGVGTDDVVAALAAVTPVPGRFEMIETDGAPIVIVDYAHTPDALGVLLAAARAIAGVGRLIAVCGCGGGRDRGKRPEMGAAAAAGADLVVVTSDNPRDEPPEVVIADMLKGMDPTRALVEVDREAAIAAALAIADPGDVVVVAGKGHETTQEIGGERRPFDDRAVVRRLLLADLSSTDGPR